MKNWYGMVVCTQNICMHSGQYTEYTRYANNTECHNPYCTCISITLNHTNPCIFHESSVYCSSSV